jgi:hypothetical protein
MSLRTIGMSSQSIPATSAPRLLLNAREAARILSVSERTLWSLSAPRGPIPVVRLPGGRGVRYSTLTLANWIARQENQATVDGVEGLDNPNVMPVSVPVTGNLE